MGTDKLNRVDFQWFTVRTQPRQERRLVDIITRHQQTEKNILEVYCPAHTKVKVHRNGKIGEISLFTGFVFVLATRQALSDLLEQHFPDGVLLYDYSKKTENAKAPLLTIPENEMRKFRDFNENYAEEVIVLERPYSDYAFNPKSNEPNEIVRVIDGPLAGREGYLCKFRRDKRVVFQMRGLHKDSYFTISLPHAWNFNLVRLHNAESDRLTVATQKDRAADLLFGILQSCGYGVSVIPKFYEIIEQLTARPSIVHLCQDLLKKGETELGQRLKAMSPDDAKLIMNLVRYERENLGFVRDTWRSLSLRPFLTPTSGVHIPDGRQEAELKHRDFTEIIRRVEITEEVFYPSKSEGEKETSVYYAHVGIMPVSKEENGETRCVIFANWDDFLREYFLTGGKANEKLVSGTPRTLADDAEQREKTALENSFRNFAPTLYRILTDPTSEVKAVEMMKVGDKPMNVMAVTAQPDGIGQAKDTLINTGIKVCREINTTTHLAIWRRCLRTVWLHR